jgi:AcrR family transcriptional regulator
VGRPARVDRDAIAEAVLEIGLSQSSMKAVAAHLGVSVPGLYHHVKNRRELLLLAAERSMAQARLPEDRGQHWSEWLREWGRYSRDAFVEDPEVFDQYLRGAVNWDRMLEVVDSVISILTRQGFVPTEALAAWDAVGRCAIGSAVHVIRSRTATEQGRPPVAEMHRVLARRPSDQLLGARAVVDAFPGDDDAAFEDEVTTVLVGIAVRRGERWEDIAGR